MERALVQQDRDLQPRAIGRERMRADAVEAGCGGAVGGSGGLWAGRNLQLV